MNHDHSHGMGKHMLLMLICCLVPIGLILAVSVLGLSLGPLQPLVPYAIALVCPLMMIVMMRGMMQGDDDHSRHHQGDLGHVDAPPTRSTKQISGTAQGAVKTTAAAGREKCH